MIKKIGLLSTIFLSLAFDANNHRVGVDVEPPFARPSVDFYEGLTVTPFKVSGLDNDSLLLFRQGISATHGFFIYHAERLFREVIKRNPNHPMPYAFAAYAQMIFGAGNLDRGDRYHAKALELIEEYNGPLTQHERNWMSAIASLYQNARGTLSQRKDDHITMLRELVQNDPLDFEAKAFLALALWNWQIQESETTWLKKRDAYIDGTSVELTNEEKAIKAENAPLIQEANQLIEDVLQDYPSHPIHHYKIHLWNTPGSNHLALDSAIASGNANPFVAHLWHMPAHIFNGINEPVNAAWQLEASQRVDNQYLTSTKIQAEQIHNYAHNFDWLMIGSITTAGLKNLNLLATSALSSPRLSQDNFLTTAAASHSVAATEIYELWQDFVDLYEKGYLQNLSYAPYSKNDVILRAKIQRMFILSLFHLGFTERAESLFLEWQRGEFINSKDLLTSSKEEALESLDNIFSDLNIRRKIIQTLQDKNRDPDIDESLLNQLTTLRTPDATVAWLALDLGLKETALDLAIGATKKPPYGFHYPGSAAYANWTLAHMMYLNGKVAEAEALVAKTCKRIDHRLMNTDLPMLTRMTWAKDKILACTPQQGHLEHTRSVKLEDLGPLALKWPKFAAMPDLDWKLPTEGKTELLVFSLGKSCPACNQQFKALGDIMPQLADANISLRVISSDGSDENKKWFEAFGAIDEFTGKPIHALYLIDAKGNARFYHHSVHAVMDMKFLLNEVKRLAHLPMQD